jgi:hypothetical protein
MATWRNGSAFGFDCQRNQKAAGSSPAVVNGIFCGLCKEYRLFSSQPSEDLNDDKIALMQKRVHITLAAGKISFDCIHVLPQLDLFKD